VGFFSYDERAGTESTWEAPDFGAVAMQPQLQAWVNRTSPHPGFLHKPSCMLDPPQETAS
jgi:hypothetical protein